jgi:GAF domain-containing protein
VTSPDDLRTLFTRLSAELARHPALALAQAVALLDPVHYLNEDALDELLYYGYDEDRETLILAALSVARRCLPAAYVELVAGIRSGWDFNAVSKAFNAGLKRAYPYLDMPCLYDLVYGVPLDFVGLDLTDPDFPHQHPGYAAFLAEYFGLEAHEVPATRWLGAYRALDEGEVDAVRPLIRRLVASLIAADAQPWADMALTLMYLFGMTDNSLLDWPHEAYYEAGFEPLEWLPDRLALANEAAEQAAVVLAATRRTLDLLAADEAVSLTLKANIAALHAAERSTHVPDDLTLSWPRRVGPTDAGRRPAGGTGPDAAFLLVRDCFV